MSADRDDVRRNGRRDGERRKRRTLTALEARRELFVLRGRRALLVTLLDAGSATADDVRDVVTLPADIDPKLFGSVPSQLAFAGIIRADGFVKTSRPKAHARPIQRWALVNRDRAERWLIDHPERDAIEDSKSGPPVKLFTAFVSQIGPHEVKATPEEVAQATPEKVKNHVRDLNGVGAACSTANTAATVQQSLFDDGEG